MITYFLEQDLVSFGNYLLSPIRKQFYLDQGVPEDKVDDLLGAVNNIDLTNWVNLVMANQRQQQEVTSEETTANESQPEGDDPQYVEAEEVSPLRIV